MIVRPIFPFLAFAFAGVLASASAESFTRDGAIATAVKNNHELAVASLAIDRAQSRLRWAGRLSNPEIEISASTDQFGPDDDEGGFEIAFAQRFPVTARLKNEKIVRRQDVELASIEFQSRQRQLAFEVDKAWIALYDAQRAKELQTRLLDLNDEISSFMSERAPLGEVSSLDAAQASLNGKLLEQQVGIADAAILSVRSRLTALIGLAPSDPASIEGSLSLPASQPAASLDIQSVLANRPDYSYLLASGELGLAQLALARSQRWDDVSVRLFGQRENDIDEPDGLERNNFVGIGFSIPLPLFNKNEAAIEDAQIDIEKARRQQVAKAFKIESELAAALRARRAAYQLVAAAGGEALPLAQENLEQFKAAQQSGQATLLQVQQAQQQLLQIETSTLDLRKNYHDLDAEVRFIAGDYPIPHRNATPSQVTK